MTVGDKLCHYGLDKNYKLNEIGKIIAIYSYKKKQEINPALSFCLFLKLMFLLLNRKLL